MRIGVRGTNWIGDAVMSVPALRALRQAFPDAEIELFTPSWAKDVFEDSNLVNRISVINSDEGLRSQVSAWRSRKFDLAILFTNSFRSALVTRLGKTSRQFGYRNEGRRILLSDSFDMPIWKDERHEIFYYLDLVSKVESRINGTVEFSNTPPDTCLLVSDSKRLRAKEIFRKAGIPDDAKIIAVGAGSQNSLAKRWGAENFASLLDQLSDKFDFYGVLLGSESEIDVANRVSGSAKTAKIVNLSGKTTLSEAISILAQADLMVSNDMGLAHISSAVGTKTFTIFGPTNPTATAPWGGEVIKAAEIACAPCMLRKCPIDHRCMTQIPPASLAELVANHLKTR